MDIRKLQRTIVDGLEDVKAQNIAVFNTEHLSALFERVIIASGTSNRQTKALASSVRDAVKGAGFPIPRTEGETNGEWIIIDCGAAVVHVMQPNIRDYYHLEELWGDKPIALKLGPVRKLVKASEPEPQLEPVAPSRSRTAAKRSPARKTAAPPAHGAGSPERIVLRRVRPSDSLPTRADGTLAAPVKRPRRPAAAEPAPTAARKAPAGKRVASAGSVTRVVGVRQGAAREAAVVDPETSRSTARRSAVTKTVGTKAAGTKVATTKVAATKSAAAKSSARTAPATRPTVAKAPAGTSAAANLAARSAPGRKVPAKKALASEVATKKAPIAKAPAKRPAAKKAPRPG